MTRTEEIQARLEKMRGIGPEATIAKLNSAADIRWLLDRVEALTERLSEVQDHANDAEGRIAALEGALREYHQRLPLAHECHHNRACLACRVEALTTEAE